MDFLQKGLVVWFLRKKGASDEQSAYVERLQRESGFHPNEACAQLFQALRGNDDFHWNGETLRNLDDLVVYLEHRLANLDNEISALLDSQRFNAWLKYLGIDNLMENIKGRH